MGAGAVGLGCPGSQGTASGAAVLGGEPRDASAEATQVRAATPASCCARVPPLPASRSLLRFGASFMVTGG